jgi:nucleoside-diphosphate-sugar epimerase
MTRVKTLLSAQLGFLLPVLLLLTTFHTSRALAATSIVTGANGYVGRAVVQVLLEDKDQSVLCLVRPSRVDTEREYWKSCQNVRVMPYDMVDGGTTIADAIESCSSDGSEEICVYHIASVFGPTEDHVQTANDNVQGTVDLVHALGKVPNARLVLTSSMAALRGTGQDPLNGKFYTHEDWNTKSKLGENWGASYQWSKAESEKQATTLAKQYDLPMTSLCPSFVFGPPTDNSNLSSSFSITLVGQWVRGESPVQSRLCVDIRDIARAHVAAGTREEAKGKRFVVSTEARVPSQGMAEALKGVCEDSGLGDPAKITYDGTFSGGAIPIGEKEVEAESRLEEYLGVKLRPVEET